MPGDVLVGRRLAIGALRSAVGSAISGEGRVVLLAGDAGMGKTALALETAAYGKAQGALTLWGTCWAGDGAPGYWPWIQVLRGLGAEPDAGASETVLAELTGSGAAEGLLGDEAAARFRTYDATATYLRQRASQQPLLVVFDDLHWADASTLRLLLFLARQLRDARTLVIGAYRDVEITAAGHPARDLLAELAGQAELLRLTALTVGEVGELLHKVCGEQPPPALIGAVHERTGGNPFYVQQLGRLLASQGEALERAPLTGIPPAVAEVLARRLARLPHDVVDLLAVAAVIGKRFSIALVDAVDAAVRAPTSSAGVSTEATVEALDLGARAGIVELDPPGAARFAHDLFREVLYDGLTAARRSRLHLTVADLLARGAGPATTAAEIAHHRTMALPLGNRDLAVAALVDAGKEATTRTAYDEAAGHLVRAVEVAGGVEAVELALLCSCADALRRAGNSDDARGAYIVAAQRARTADDPEALARAAFGLHRVPILTGSSRADVIDLLQVALAALPAPTGEVHWLLMASLARELSDGLEHDRAQAVTLANAAVAGARRSDVRSALAYALFALGDVRWEPGSAIERLAIAEELTTAAAAAGETELVLEGHLAKLVALLELGDPAFSIELDAFSRLALRAAIPRYVYVARSRHATLATLTGPLELADDLIADAAAYGERIGEPDRWGVEASQLVGLACFRHDWTRLKAVAAARGEPLSPPEFALHERCWLLIEAGEREAAAALVAELPDRPAIYRWRQAALLTMDAELATAVGDTARCAALYEQLLPLADQFAVVASAVFTTGPVALQLGLLAGVLGRRDEALRHLEDAAARCDRLGARLFRDRIRDELDRLRATPPECERPERPNVNELFLDGEMWTISFAGRSAQLRDAKGLRDLAVLLAAPGQEVPATQLVAGGSGGLGPAIAALGSDPVLDERARASYRQRLTQLDDLLADADAHGDAERSARVAGERDLLLAELARARGLAGRSRLLGAASERARSTVTARIRDSIRRIERAHPELGQHLRTSVVTGARCSYRPAETVRWRISQL